MSNEKLFSIQTGKITHFTEVDYVLFGLLLVISAGIGLFFAIKDRKHNNTKTFLMAGGEMSPFPVALSLLASFMSAITILGTPAEMYNYTTMYYWIGLSYLFVAFGAAHVFMPIFYQLRVRSAYEYLEHRFSRGVRTAGSMTFCVQMLLYMALVLYAPSLALNSVTGFTLWGSVISVGIVCTLYTTIGGMKAVLFTDSFQVGMMFAGLLAILIQGNIELGGFHEAWKKAEESGRVYFDDFSPDPKVRHSVWSLVIGGTFTWVAIYGVNQAQVQRYCTCPSLRKAQIAIWLNFPGLCLILYLCCLIGMVVYAFYSTCDPFSFNLVKTSDQLLPLFVMDVLGHLKGFPGLFVACLFSGALSTISSGLSALAAVVLEDVIKAYMFKDLSENAATNTSKGLAFVFGIICLGLTYVASLLGGVLQAALSLFGMIGGPLLGLFILGMMFPWANKWGAYTGLLLGLVFMFWIGVGAQIYPPHNPKSAINITGCNWNLTTPAPTPTPISSFNASTTAAAISSTTALLNPTTPTVVEETNVFQDLYALSYMWYSATAVLFVVVVGLIVSFLTGPQDPKELDPRLICPLFDILFPYLPEKIRKPLRFGVRHGEVKDKTKKGEGGVYADVNIDILNQEIQVDSNGKTKEIQVNGRKSMANQSIPNGTPNGGFVGDETEMVSRL
nr:sodium-coupled monocarboxylate transporter 1 [Crassostrea gigas]XP_034311782.1 sodium-coupled monocarboxylate transporter 1 [Crassostrea gigas]XP_034311783.1 sodium-coupled monocarboxylate transporter 1 [Crassostrea gigas]XP_034311784.1 sodium-coupled monocarboxylate transporter 1 [Crassostrea gigas]